MSLSLSQRVYAALIHPVLTGGVAFTFALPLSLFVRERRLAALEG
jgi:hypothetical protein